jgi:hypothetical protein
LGVRKGFGEREKVSVGLLELAGKQFGAVGHRRLL